MFVHNNFVEKMSKMKSFFGCFILLLIVLTQQCNSTSVTITKPLSGSIDVSVPVTVNLELEGSGDIDSSSIVCYEIDINNKKCTPLSAAVLEPIEGLEPGISYTLSAYITNSKGVRLSVITQSQFKTAESEKITFGLIKEESLKLQQLGVDSYWAGDLVSSAKLFKAVSLLDSLNGGSWEGAGASHFGLGLYDKAAIDFLSAINSAKSENINMMRNTRAARNWELLDKLVDSTVVESQSGGGMVSVVSTFFRGKGKYSELRFQEIITAQLANIHNPDIDTLVLVADVKSDCNPFDYLGYHDKLKVVQQESSGAPSWGELYKVGEDMFSVGSLVVFSHADMAYFHQNASLNLLPTLLHADMPVGRPLPPASGGGDSARPIAIALTRRPHSACPWQSGGGHLHEIPVDLCSGPHGAAEGVIGFDAFAMILPVPPLLISLADQLRTNHLGVKHLGYMYITPLSQRHYSLSLTIALFEKADLKMVEAMSLCDMLIVDPCVLVVGTHLHCTLERSYRADEDWVTMQDVEAGRYSIAVRPTRLPLHSAFDSDDSKGPSVIVGFHGSGDDLIRSSFEAVGSVEYDSERVYAGLEPHNCESSLSAVVIPSIKFPKVGDTHFVSLDGLRRSVSWECSRLITNVMSVPIGHPASQVRVVIVRDPYDTIAQNFIYMKTTHRTSHFMPRRDRSSGGTDNLMKWVAREYMLSDPDWQQYALTNANKWVKFYNTITSTGDATTDKKELLVVKYSELIDSELGLKTLESVLGLTYKARDASSYSSYSSSSPMSPLSLGHLDNMANTDAFGAGLRNEFASIVSPTMCVFDMKLPFDDSCDSVVLTEVEVEVQDLAALHFESTDAYNRLTDECGIGKYSKCVVAFSLYGDDERYTGGVLANARDMHHSISKRGVLGPYWHMRVYHNDSSPFQVLQALEELGVEMIHVDSKEGQLSNPRAWRFQVAADDKVNRFLLRDVDSRIGFREVCAITAWVKSGLPFHVMRDHPRYISLLMSTCSISVPMTCFFLSFVCQQSHYLCECRVLDASRHVGRDQSCGT